MNGSELTLIITLVIIVLMILSGAWFVNSLILLIKLRMHEKSITNLHMQLEEDNSKITTEYSEKLLNFVKMITTQVAILQFRTFVDGHDMAKVTKANVRDVADNVAKTVKSSINMDSIDFSDTLFTKEFYESYIIETSIIAVKSLLEKTINIDE